MKITITGSPVFHLGIDLATVEALISLSIKHYDATCRAAGQVGGFLYGWRNRLRFAEEEKAAEPDAQVAVPSATWRELDITLKIIEWMEAPMATTAADRALLYKYREAIVGALRAFKENKPDWRIEV